MRLSPLFRKFEIRWSKAGSAQLFADLEQTARELAEAADATPFYALEGGPLSTFTTVHPLGGCPMADDPARRRRRRPRARARPAGPVRARRLDRPDLARRQPVEDDRRARRARRGRAGGGAGLSPEWHNHTGNQRCEPRGIERPSSLEELVALVRRAEAEGTTVRAVGAGHSWSDAALTDGYLVLPDRLGGIVDVDGRLVRVLGGTHLRDLNAALDARGLALPHMGGYDEQTIAGVVSTSTHGSGLNWGPFPDFVRSLELVVAGGEVVRIERRRTPTGFDAAVVRDGHARPRSTRW